MGQRRPRDSGTARLRLHGPLTHSARAVAVALTLALSAVAPPPAMAAGQPLLLLREPTLSKQAIVFEYGGELWRVPRSGGAAHVLAGGMDRLRAPIYSPDGSKVAFTGKYDGNTDVYVVDANGGQPRRLTYHPGEDVATAWTPDGKRVLFRSSRYSHSDPDQLYTVAATAGGLPYQLPLAEAETGSYSPDGKRLAYVPGFQWEPYWKDYKGGQYTSIWLARLADSSVVRVPNKNGASDNSPMWLGDTVYFLSNRGGPITLYAYDTATKNVRRVLTNNGFDITSASAGPRDIVYSQFGQLHIFDPASGKAHAVPVTVAGDMPQRRPHFQKVAGDIENSAISPSGVRALFEAHGEILSVPTRHGNIRDLSNTPGAAERQPAWSPDGKKVAWFSDRAGEYDLYIRPQNSVGRTHRIKLGADDAFYYDPTWSPDSKKLLFSDQKLNLWMVDLSKDQPTPVKIATDNYAQLHEFDARWSPDGQWVAYTKVLPNYLHAVFVYSLADQSAQQITDGMSDALFPVFDANGKTLYFTSSTDTALTHGWLDMTAMERPVTRHVYAATLIKGLKSPLAPSSGFENVDNKDDAHAHKHHGDKPAKNKKSPADNIDFKGLQARAVALPIAAANYVGMAAGKTGVLYLQKAPLVSVQPPASESAGPAVAVERLKLADRKVDKLVTGVNHVSFTPDGRKMLYQKGAKKWYIARTEPQSGGGHKAKAKKLEIAGMRVKVVPQAEWAQMYHDAWRFQRAFFYDKHFDGLDVDAAEKEFAHYLPGIVSRAGLSFLFKEMLSYMSVGHMFIRGGHQPHMAHIKTGLLGADYTVDHGHYRIKRIYDGGAWNPDMPAPLAGPGVKVKAGEYLLAVNGRRLDASHNLYAAFENLADQQVSLTVGPNPGMQGAHTVTVSTIDNEHGLRNAAWIEHNRKLVDKLSHGKLAYVYLPDTWWGGYKNFNRYYFAQVDKQGVIVDERFNHGGLLSDYIIEYLQRKPRTLNITRWGHDAVTPPEAIFGPRVMVINQFSGSGGDALPWYFKRDDIGTLVGKRTWGGLVGISGFPKLMDGGTVTAPNTAVEGIDGHFPVENHGVAPDVAVWQNPQALRNGHDPQLERAVKIAMKKLTAKPRVQYKPASSRNYHPKLPPLPTPNAAD